MTIQDRSNAPHSSALLTGGNGISLDAGGQNLTGECHVPKIRKPYTITKPRERWTEEEHMKFLEAIKLYGRAWRKIEEHIGTKTAVQIRSHAQKFFFKVVRESSDNNSSSIKPFNIPPPRPKRKPVHPYPRKLVTQVKKEKPLQEHSARSMSPNSSVVQENQSPTSVLSRFPSDATGFADWETLDGSSSPVSSPDDLNRADYLPSENDSSGQENVSHLDEPVRVKLELSSKVDAFGKEGSVEATSTKSLKLFGKTFSVADSEKPSTPSPCPSKTRSIDISEGLAQELEDVAVVNADNLLCQNSPALLPTLSYTNGDSHAMEVGPSAPSPWWPFHGGMTFPYIPLNVVSLAKADIQGKEMQKGGYLSRSNTDSINVPGSCDKNSDAETLSHVCFHVESPMIKESLNPVSQSNPSAKLKSSSSEKQKRGFLPYKRSLAERETQSSTVTDEKNESQRARLCL